MEHQIRTGFESSTTELNDGVTVEGIIPQLLSQTTSLFKGCFSADSADLDTPHWEPIESMVDEQELVTFSSGRVGINQSSSRINYEIISESSSTTAADTDAFDETARTLVESSSQSVVTLVDSSRTNPNEVSLFQGLIERARRTIRGSADDIGWLERASAMPPAEDGTQQFIEIIDDIRHGLHKLPTSLVYLLIPGLFSNHGPLYFVNIKTSFSKMGLACFIAKIHSEASVETNAREIKDYIEEIYWGSQKRILLLGHSKGGVDAAAALSMYWPDLKDKVAGLALAQSPYGGSPIASDILREGQLGDYVNFRQIMEIIVCKVLKGDMQALEDLTYERRKEFLKKYPLPEELPVVSFHTEAGISPAVLSTIAHVAHAELPLGQPTKIPVVLPRGAAMAACAQLLLTRYGEKSDGLVTCRDAVVPGSVFVRLNRKLDHAWMVYSSLDDDPSDEANAAQVCEALLTLVMEVGEKKRHEHEKRRLCDADATQSIVPSDEANAAQVCDVTAGSISRA